MILNIGGKSTTAGRQATSGTLGVADSGGKYATGVVDTSANQIFIRIFANETVANNGNNIRLFTPSSEHNKKTLYLYVNSPIQKCPNKI
jgi:hypothetical protein